MTLAEVLRKTGYRTGAFLSAFPLTEWFGLDQGFDHFDSDFLEEAPEDLVSEEGVISTGDNQRGSDETTDRVLSWLGAGDGPFFAWIHYFDPHDPYILPPYGGANPLRDFAGDERELLRAIYDIEVAAMDRQIGRVLAGRLVRSVVRTIDILPTVLELAAIAEDDRPSSEGESLVALIDGVEEPAREAYSDGISTMEYDVAGVIRESKDDVLLSVTTDRWKYVHHVYRPERSELFDMRSDPAERFDVSAENPEVVAGMRKSLVRRDCFPARRLVEDDGVSPEVAERLSSLGYVAR